MIKYIITDSLDGIYTAVYDSFYYKEQVEDILTSDEQMDFLSVYKNINVDKEKASKVAKKLKNLL